MALDGLSGEAFGPVRVRMAAEKVAEFVVATGDDEARWTAAAPPAFAAALLFQVAPALLADDRVRRQAAAVIHVDQRFVWHGPLAVDGMVDVSGSVDGVRARGSLHFVTFAATVASIAGGPVVDSTSTFLLSDRAATETVEHVEAAPTVRGPNDPIGAVTIADGAVALSRSASRLDLVRYAGATGDWNPIHWDHGAAVAAGLPGVVVHGPLMLAWTAQAAGAFGSGPAPLAELDVRFRKPLSAAAAASVSARLEAEDGGEVGLAVAVRSQGRDLVTGRVRARET